MITILLTLIVVSIVIIWLISYKCYHEVNRHHKYIPLTDYTPLKRFYGNTPWLSVVVSIYNKQDIMKATIDSIINSSIFDYIEVILVDDCSKDNSLKIANEYANKYANVKVIKHATNQSIFMTRKHGVKQASDQYVHFMDGDDTVDKHFYEELLRFMASVGRKYDIICANNINRVYKHKQQHMYTLCSKSTRETKDSKPNDKYILYEYNNGKNPFIDNGKLSKYVVYMWTKLYRTDFIKQVFANIKDTYINLAEDVFTNYYITRSLHSYIVINNVNKYNYYLVYDSVSHQCSEGIGCCKYDFIKKGLESLKDVKNKLGNTNNKESLALQSGGKQINRYLYNVVCRGIKDCSRIEITRLFNN